MLNTVRVFLVQVYWEPFVLLFKRSTWRTLAAPRRTFKAGIGFFEDFLSDSIVITTPAGGAPALIRTTLGIGGASTIVVPDKLPLEVMEQHSARLSQVLSPMTAIENFAAAIRTPLNVLVWLVSVFAYTAWSSLLVLIAPLLVPLLLQLLSTAVFRYILRNKLLVQGHI